MKGLLLALFVIVTIVGTAIMTTAVRDRIAVKRGMPDGYYLEVNAKGEFRPCRDGRPLRWFVGSGTKAEAIRRARAQEEAEKRMDIGWKRYNEKGDTRE